MTWRDRWTILRLRLVIALWPKRGGTFRICGNRVVRSTLMPHTSWEYTLTETHLREPDYRSREELMAMLAVIRREEARMGWKTPEPQPIMEDV